MNTPARLFSAVRSCSRITSCNSFYISRRFLTVNPNNEKPRKTLIEKIKWQVWRPTTDSHGRMEFWNVQYNVGVWSCLLFLALCFLFPAEDDIKKRNWVERFIESFMNETFNPKEEPDNGLPKIPEERMKTIEENRARIRRAIEARERAKLGADPNRPKSIAEQLAELEVDKK